MASRVFLSMGMPGIYVFGRSTAIAVSPRLPPTASETQPGGPTRHGTLGGTMTRTIMYWVTTAIVALMLLLALTYLSGAKEVAEGFTKVGYPQHLRVVLGFLKPAAAIVILVPRLARLKEWAYAGATFA